MYNFKVHILTSLGFWLWRQKVYGFKNVVKLGGWQTNFKITLGTRIFKKSCSTSRSSTGNRCFFQKSMLKKLQIKIKRNVVLQQKLQSCSKSSVRASFASQQTSQKIQASQAKLLSREIPVKWKKSCLKNQSETSKQTKENHKSRKFKPNQSK